MPKATSTTTSATEQVYSVKSLMGEISAYFKENYWEIWVEGEISGLAEPASGHKYFSLKEGDALIRCAMFKSRQSGAPPTPPAEGMQALVRGRVAIYEPRGDMQLIVSYLEDAGEGALRREFEQLKRKLLADGLFEASHKKPLPAWPKTIGIISSASGAVLHDIRVTLNRRYPIARLIVYPTAVQGAEAAPGIVKMLAIANQRREADVLIVARGGGSLEDLQPFNDESVARAIFASELPVVSAVGHEVDYTIADMVADQRAPTPTAAAETIAPELAQMRQSIRHATALLHRNIKQIVDNLDQRLDHTTTRLVHPLSRIESAEQTHQTLAATLTHLIRRRLDQHQLRLQEQNAELRYCSPVAKLTENLRTLAAMRQQLLAAATTGLATSAQTIHHLTGKLDLMSPAHTLERGYAILQDDAQAVVSDAGKTSKGQTLTARVARGKFLCVVDSVLEKDKSF